MREIAINEIHAFRIGHAQDASAATGCTAIVCAAGAVGGVDVRGNAPATRETDLLAPQNTVESVHTVLLCGGSAFGLDAAAGAMTYLEAHGCGVDTGIARVPIVVAAALFDLAVGSAAVRPDRTMGYAAMVNSEKNTLQNGNIGAGCGASVGKLLGMERAMKGGLGCYALAMGDLQVGAVVAVNALGNVVTADGQYLAGVRAADNSAILPAEELLCGGTDTAPFLRSNTTIGCILSNAALTKAQAHKVASMAHDGLARSIRPVHTANDGDCMFALASGAVKADADAVGTLAALATEGAIRLAVRSAEAAYGLPAARDLAR